METVYLLSFVFPPVSSVQSLLRTGSHPGPQPTAPQGEESPRSYYRKSLPGTPSYGQKENSWIQIKVENGKQWFCLDYKRKTGLYQMLIERLRLRNERPIFQGHEVKG